MIDKLKIQEAVPKILTCIPYHPGNLGKAYNEFMETVNDTDWVLFLDHDIMVLRPDWYDMCIETIQFLEKDNKKIGWITGVTNSIHCKDQQIADAPSSMDIKDHIKFSDQLYEKYGGNVGSPSKVSEKFLDNVFSGMFILTNKKAWEDVGGFEEEDKIVEHVYNNQTLKFRTNKFLGVDNDYFLKLAAAGYEQFIMPGLYMYHLREKKSLYKKFNKPTKTAPIIKPKKMPVFTQQTQTGNRLRKINKKPTISVCMIVRGEEKNMHRCLTSIKPIADEIIVIDTSLPGDPPDRSDEIAKEYGAKVYYHPWEDNFSKGRNQSIQYATKDWLFFIDADEEFVGDTKKFKNKWLKKISPQISSITFILKDIQKGQVTCEMTDLPKMFRKGTVYYEGIVHNQPMYDHYRSKYCDFVHYRHYGYDGEASLKEKKFKRTSGLLLQRIEQNPDDHSAYCYLSNIYGEHGYLDEQIKYGKQYISFRTLIEARGIVQFDPTIFFSLTRSLTQQKKFQEAMDIVHEGLMVDQDNIDISFAGTELGVIAQNKPLTLQCASRYISLYRKYQEQGNISKAKSIYTNGIANFRFCVIQLFIHHMKDARIALAALEETSQAVDEGSRKRIENITNGVLKTLGFALIEPENPSLTNEKNLSDGLTLSEKNGTGKAMNAA